MLAVTAAGAVPLGLISNELEAEFEPETEAKKSVTCWRDYLQKEQSRLTVIHLRLVQLVVAAVDEKQRVGTRRNAVDEDLRRAVLRYCARERLTSVSMSSIDVSGRSKVRAWMLTWVRSAFPIWKLPLSALLFELSSCTEK